MIKLTFCLHRLPTMTRLTFEAHWFETYVPLVTKHRDVLRIRRYVQVHSVTLTANDAIRDSRGAPEGYDGVAELWWDTFDDIFATPTPERQAAALALLEDERKFIDLSRSPLWFGEERPIF